MKKHGFRVTHYPEDRAEIVTAKNGKPFRTAEEAKKAMWEAAQKENDALTGAVFMETADDGPCEYQEKITLIRRYPRTKKENDILAVWEYLAE